MTDLASLCPREQSALLAEARTTARELTEATLAALERASDLNAVTVLRRDDALLDADEADRRRAAGDAGPLLGVPIVVKDDLDVAGLPTGRGSRAFGDVAEGDSDLVAAMRAAGMVVVAKSTLPELAIYGFTESAATGITRNPHDLGHTPGGSSGGSAALVAAGAVGIATASDGAGSIRIPAACCGLVGFKPTNGTMPSSGGWHDLSTQGCLAREVADVALFLDTFGEFGESLVEAASTEPRRLRVGLSLSASAATKADRLDPAVGAALDATASRLRALGHSVALVTIPYGLDAKALTVRYLTGIRDAADAAHDPTLLEDRTRAIARLGRPFRRGAIEWSKEAGRRFGDGVHDGLGVDVLLTPVMSGPALPVQHFDGRGAVSTVLAMNSFYPYTAQWNHAGLPAVSLPAGKAGNLPLAVQLIGRRNDDATLISLAAQLERS